MNIRKKLPLCWLSLLAASALSLGLSACRQAETGAQPPTDARQIRDGFPRRLRDGGGEEVAIKARPVRIVSQTLGTDEILWAICRRERLAGVSKISLEPKYSSIADELKAAKITPIMNAEEILQLQPDLVFVASYSLAETVEHLKAAGATVFRFASFDSIDDIQQNIRLVGQAIGEEAAAEKLVTRMQTELNEIRSRIPRDTKPPRVVSFHPAGNTAGANTSFDSIVRAAGSVNVAAEKGLKGFPKISAEQVIEWQPDFIITGTAAAKFDEMKKQLLADPVIATTEAARNGRIVILDNRYLLSVSHFITHAVRDLADGLYRGKAEAADAK